MSKEAFYPKNKRNKHIVTQILDGKLRLLHDRKIDRTHDAQQR